MFGRVGNASDRGVADIDHRDITAKRVEMDRCSVYRGCHQVFANTRFAAAGGGRAGSDLGGLTHDLLRRSTRAGADLGLLYRHLCRRNADIREQRNTECHGRDDRLHEKLPLEMNELSFSPCAQRIDHLTPEQDKISWKQEGFVRSRKNQHLTVLRGRPNTGIRRQQLVPTC